MCTCTHDHTFLYQHDLQDTMTWMCTHEHMHLAHTGTHMYKHMSREAQSLMSYTFTYVLSHREKSSLSSCTCVRSLGFWVQASLPTENCHILPASPWCLGELLLTASSTALSHLSSQSQIYSLKKPALILNWVASRFFWLGSLVFLIFSSCTGQGYSPRNCLCRALSMVPFSFPSLILKSKWSRC